MTMQNNTQTFKTPNYDLLIHDLQRVSTKVSDIRPRYLVRWDDWFFKDGELTILYHEITGTPKDITLNEEDLLNWYHERDNPLKWEDDESELGFEMFLEKLNDDAYYVCQAMERFIVADKNLFSSTLASS